MTQDKTDIAGTAADLLGVLPEYFDLSGQRHVASNETLHQMVRAMGAPEDMAALSDFVAHEKNARDRRRLPRAVVVAAGEPARLAAMGHGLDRWQCRSCHQTASLTLEGDIENGEVALPTLPVGYYLLTLGEEADETLIIVAPPRAPSVADVAGGETVWGVTAALYGLRSHRNFGIGDFRDLSELARILSGTGADFLGINPVHAIGHASDHISPYSPSHRSFVNAAHIAVDWACEHLGLPAVSRVASDADEMSRLREADHIAYAPAKRLRDGSLRELFANFQDLDATNPHRQDLEAFKQLRGVDLSRFAIFEAISELHGSDWHGWPTDLQDVASGAVSEFARENAASVEYHAFLQWLAHTQLLEAQRHARESGMAVGLYADLAVGVRPDGAEPWACPDAFAAGVSLGAPPDQFNADGQRWNLAPLNPHGLAKHHYRPFISAIRGLFSFSGMIRIDHAIGLMRCFWLPDEDGPGAYVRYPLDVLLAIIRVEAALAGGLVVGEDLGVVPEGLREALAASGLYGCSVMQFERVADGRLAAAPRGRRDVLACFGTHDTPTLRGFVSGADIDHRVRLGQIDEANASQQRSQRQKDVARLMPDEGAHPPSEVGSISVSGVHLGLVNARAALTALQFDDILELADQQNMPGTTDAYPNWRLRYPVAIEDLEADPRLLALKAAMSQTDR